MAELLLANGAKFNEWNDRCKTPLEVAREYEHAKAVAIFLEEYRKKQVPAVKKSAGRTTKGAEAERVFEHGSLERVKQLLEGLTDINEILGEDSGYTALHFAARFGDAEKIRLVLRRTPNLELRSLTKLDTPLHTAVVFDHVDHVEALLKAGADIEAVAHDGLTPLHYAAMRGNADVVRLLIRRGANVGAQESNEATPLHAAAHYGHTEVAKVLLGHGANPHQEDRTGLTPIALARRKNHTTILALFGY